MDNEITNQPVAEQPDMIQEFHALQGKIDRIERYIIAQESKLQKAEEFGFVNKKLPYEPKVSKYEAAEILCVSPRQLQRIRLGLANLMLCIDNQVVDIALPVVYTLRTRQCFNVLRHFSSDSANLIIFRDVHAILNVKVSAIGISTLAVLPLSNLNYLVSLEISMLI